MSVAEKIEVKVKTRDNWKSNGPGRTYNAFEYDAVIAMKNVDPFFIEKLIAWMQSMGGNVERDESLAALPQHFPTALPTASEPATTPKLPQTTDEPSSPIPDYDPKE